MVSPEFSTCGWLAVRKVARSSRRYDLAHKRPCLDQVLPVGMACTRTRERYKALHLSSLSHSSVKHSTSNTHSFLGHLSEQLTATISSVTMRAALCIVALAGMAYSAPQLINLDQIAEDFASPVLVKAPVNVVSNIPTSSTPSAVTPLRSPSAKKRDLEVEKRDGDCSPYPAGSGPVPSPDTPAAFQSDPDFAVCLCYRIALAE